MKIKAFYLDNLPWHEGYYNLSNHFDEIDMPVSHTSYQLLVARLLNMTYEEYLIFCKEYLGAKVIRKNRAKYAAVYFKLTPDTERFVKLLNDKFEEGYKISGLLYTE